MSIQPVGPTTALWMLLIMPHPLQGLNLSLYLGSFVWVSDVNPKAEEKDNTSFWRLRFSLCGSQPDSHVAREWTHTATHFDNYQVEGQ